jgi:sarcosine oxidase, subunit delta
VLRIPCPFCGVRDEQEFIFGGPSQLTRPDPTCNDATWSEYLYFRDNPRGLHGERWHHAFGCGRWLNVLRDTLTHRIERSDPIFVADSPREERGTSS